MHPKLTPKRQRRTVERHVWEPVMKELRAKIGTDTEIAFRLGIHATTLSGYTTGHYEMPHVNFMAMKYLRDQVCKAPAEKEKETIPFTKEEVTRLITWAATGNDTDLVIKLAKRLDKAT